MRLDDGRLSWDDLHAVIFTAPPGTALFHAVEQGWTVEAHLQASAVDALHDLVWQKTKDGQKGRKRPKRVPRPKRRGEEGTASIGMGKASVMTVAELEARRAERQRRWRLRQAKGGV